MHRMARLRQSRDDVDYPGDFRARRDAGDIVCTHARDGSRHGFQDAAAQRGRLVALLADLYFSASLVQVSPCVSPYVYAGTAHGFRNGAAETDHAEGIPVLRFGTDGMEA